MTWDPDRDEVPWWTRATGYQIYPRSFCDSDGDGIGDIPGIVSKLDYLAELGIGFIWLSPVFASPMRDNGYDISDYRDIAPEFGTLADFDRLIAEARARGIRIVMDLVVNHSSSAHHWFRAACASRDAPEHRYYIWRDPAPDGGPPDDQRAVFGGPAWTFVPEVGRYHFGYFSPWQPDLDWQNPALRAEIFEMMRWWVDRGVGGFRMDVISLIGKDVDARIYEDGPYLHDHLRQMHREVLAGRDLLTVGESWSVTPETALAYSARHREELDTVFHFNHIVAFWDREHKRWSPKAFDLPTFKQVLFDWQAALADDGWNAIFLSNHDLPRQVSKYGDPGPARVASAKMLATVTHLMKGTPYIYQGEEIGMTNMRFESAEELSDVESVGQYAERVAAGMAPEDFLVAANAEGREHGRTPMQWSAAPGAGFTEGTPWTAINPNHVAINVAADRADPDGVWAHYRELVTLRREAPVVAFGRFEPFAEADPAVVAYARKLGDRQISVVANFFGEEASFDVPEGLAGEGACLCCTHGPRERLAGRISLAPYEAVALLIPAA